MTTMRPNRDFLDTDGVRDVVPESVAPTLEVGRTGLKRTGGYLNEEFLPQLRGKKGTEIYREMSQNDPIVGSLLFALERLLGGVDWRVEPASSSKEDRDNASFVESCMHDMNQPWDELVMEILSMMTYGWSWHEVVYKKRVGPWQADGKTRSKFTDGRLGWRKIPIRSQDSFSRWVFKDNSVIGLVQMPSPDYTERTIPLSKSLLFRPMAPKGSPEGFSLLRRAYRPWYFKKRFEEIEAVGVERDLAGLPVAHIPAELLSARPNTKEAKMAAAFKQMVRSVRRDENEGLIMPLAYDDKGNELYKFELLTSGGTRQMDIASIIQRYDQRILMQVMADFILVGHEGTGTYNMHTDKTGLFKQAANSLNRAIADVFNRHAIPKLFSLNAIRPHELPLIIPSDVSNPDLSQLSGFMSAMQGMGVEWFPDPKLEAYLRTSAGLPAMDKDVEEQRETQQRQAAIISMAQQKLQALQIGQQAAQGEQALQGPDPNDPANAAPGTPPPDPHADAQGAIATERAKVGLSGDKVKVEQEKAKLSNLKKPPPKAAKR